MSDLISNKLRNGGNVYEVSSLKANPFADNDSARRNADKLKNKVIKDLKDKGYSSEKVDEPEATA